MVPLFYMKILVSILHPFPQILHTYKTKRVRDLSFHTLLLILAAEFMWLLHIDFTLIASGVFSMTLSGILFGLFLFYR